MSAACTIKSAKCAPVDEIIGGLKTAGAAYQSDE
jgi:hypothetical protein